MTLDQFVNLPEEEQWLALKEAILLADREDGDFAIYLFSFHHFYVEVYCHKWDHTGGYCKAFDSTDLLAPYLEQINMEFLGKSEGA